MHGSPRRCQTPVLKTNLTPQCRQGFLLGGRGKEAEQRSQGWGNESFLAQSIPIITSKVIMRRFGLHG